MLVVSVMLNIEVNKFIRSTSCSEQLRLHYIINKENKYILMIRKFQSKNTLPMIINCKNLNV